MIVFSGNLGQSFKDDRDALEVVAERIPATLRLGFAALIFGLGFGIPLGIFAALHRNSLADRLTMSVTVLGALQDDRRLALSARAQSGRSVVNALTPNLRAFSISSRLFAP